METLIKIARYTGDKKYLEPIPRALEYLKKCLLPDGRVARYYEFKTNKPLYMDAQYQLTYDDSAAPSHYGWKQPARFEQIEKAYQDARSGAATRPRTGPSGQESGGERPQDHPGARRGGAVDHRPTRESVSSGSRSSPPRSATSPATSSAATSRP